MKRTRNRSTRPLLDRLMEKVLPEPNSGCWLWIGADNGKGGYGVIGRGRRSEPHRMDTAHKVSYELHKGPVPTGLELDHKCRVRCCVNPSHLEPVTHLENVHRGAWTPASLEPAHAAKRARTHCNHGHEFSPENTRLTKFGARVCKACDRDNHRRYAALSNEIGR